MDDLTHYMKACSKLVGEIEKLKEERDYLQELVYHVNNSLSHALAERDCLKEKSYDYEEALSALVVAQNERLSLKYGANRPEFGVWLWDKARHVLSQWVAPK